MTWLPPEASQQVFQFSRRNGWERWHIDPLLLSGLLVLMGCGLIILYSATNASNAMMLRQFARIGLALVVMLVFAQIHPQRYQEWSPWFFAAALGLLLAVLIMGKIGKGAQRWLDLGIIRFQPSECMKLAIPMMTAWFMNQRPLPPNTRTTLQALAIIGVPAVLIAKQPDLGTAIMVISAGGAVLLFAGISGRFLGSVAAISFISAPVMWHFMHDYQRQRVLTFINPENDPLGNGYHIIQSKIAIGSGGWLGKGWLHGTQSHLHFLPEHATDFIFAVCGEEFGLLGCTLLIGLFVLITLRALYIANQAQAGYARLLAGSLAVMFFVSAFVNIGMVTGILPVVGLPLPLVSYGGSSMVTLMAGFGLLMAIHTHRKFIPD